MTLNRLRDDIDGIVRRYDYDDGVTLAADLDVPDDAVTVDIVDDTAIVVVEHGGARTQYDLQIPGTNAQAFIHNGILTIEVR